MTHSNFKSCGVAALHFSRLLRYVMPHNQCGCCLAPQDGSQLETKSLKLSLSAFSDLTSGYYNLASHICMCTCSYHHKICDVAGDFSCVSPGDMCMWVGDTTCMCASGAGLLWYLFAYYLGCCWRITMVFPWI